MRNRTSLLEPGVPIHAHTHHLCHFRSSESRRFAPASSRQSHIFRRKPCPARTQKISKFMQAMVLLLLLKYQTLLLCPGVGNDYRVNHRSLIPMNSAHLVLGSPSVYHRYAGEVPAKSQVKGKV